MSSLREIQNAIGALSTEDRAALLSWLTEADREAWDQELARDFSAGGPGMKLLQEVDEQIRRGDFQSME